ncbi:TonB-dependent siderophore receptor [Methylocystis hirsuta]|uniref:TonB-dependent siderophore receptor n=1 Tax=Methylocystis hirsuta TaxID=369798 RepID=A0A3M9XQY2_9HYPH|nr:TonB-dependent siderophore receptor [Methylocystis hirsuta]RNJ50444.1 TonB-dependent siderophore receptor [Methylocystis hirsuta]
MNSSVLLCGVASGALTLLISYDARAQQALPTIDVGGARRAPTTRGAGEPNSTPSAAAAGQAAASEPGVASRFPSEPKTPEEGYVVRNASTGTKADIPIRETPVTINVVPKQVMIDQNDTNIQEALENVPSVHSNSNELEGYNFTIRGFRSLYIYRNNLAIPAGEGNPGGFDTANLERIEVLKGPASVLYGRAEPGGLINLITKQPLDQPLFRVEQQIGSFDHYRTQWDISQPVAQVPGLAYRVSGAYQTNGSFRAFQGGERVLIAPVVSYRPSDWTEFTVDTQFLGQHAQSDTGVPIFGARPAPIPLSRSFQEPNDPRDRVDSFNIGYKFRQNLNEDWKVTNRFNYAATPYFSKPNVVGFCADPTFCVDADGRTLQRYVQYQFLDGNAFSTNIDLEGKFVALGGKHIFLMGLDYLNGYYDYYFSNGAGTFPIDMYSPVYGTVPSFAYWDAKIGTGFKGHSSVLTRQKGFYVQDHVTWFDTLHVMLGARYDVGDVTVGSVDGGFDPVTDAPLYNSSKQLAIADRLASPTLVDTAWSPRAGVVYDVLPELSVYGSYSQSFGLNNGISADGQPFPAQRGKQWEVGLKSEPLPGLSATLAFYQITKSGVLTRDFSSPNPAAVSAGGLQRSRGIELDVMGRVYDRIAIIANYAYMDAKVISDSAKDPLDPYGSGFLYNHLVNAPRHAGKIFATYDFGENGLGLRAGVGVTASTHVWGDLQNTFLLPGWARLDGFASYATLVEGHKVTAQLNLKNINNAQYFTGVDNYFNASARFNALPAPPFTATGQIRVEF